MCLATTVTALFLFSDNRSAEVSPDTPALYVLDQLGMIREHQWKVAGFSLTDPITTILGMVEIELGYVVAGMYSLPYNMERVWV